MLHSGFRVLLTRCIMYKKLESYIGELKEGFDRIPASRKENLRKIAEYIQSKLKNSETVKLNFICTHNSRRSHFAQIWAAIAVHHYGLKRIETYSCGTEATAFNPKAVSAIERAGFEVESTNEENPHYKIRFSPDIEPLICFSKKIDNPVNPDRGFGAIMTCSHADENCPFVPGAEFRASITYRDPKESDGTKKETQTYDKRCKQIAAEMFYMTSQV